MVVHEGDKYFKVMTTGDGGRMKMEMEGEGEIKPRRENGLKSNYVSKLQIIISYFTTSIKLLSICQVTHKIDEYLQFNHI